MFDPLSMLRQARDDTQLTTAEYAIICAAIGRTNRNSGRVRASQEMLAEDAKTTSRTVRTFYRSKAFERYFDAEWSGRRLELTFRSPEATPEAIPEATPEAASAHLLSTTSATSTEEEIHQKVRNSFLLDDY